MKVVRFFLSADDQRIIPFLPQPLFHGYRIAQVCKVPYLYANVLPGIVCERWKALLL